MAAIIEYMQDIHEIAGDVRWMFILLIIITTLVAVRTFDQWRKS